MVRGVWGRWSFALVISALLGWPPQAAAQQSSLPPNVIAPSKDSSVIRNQLTLARKLEQQALEGLMAMPKDNSVPIDRVAHQAATDAYVLMRAALHGMGWQKDAKKYPDPAFDLVYKRVDSAWNLSRYPVDRATWGMARADYVQASVEKMTQAIRLLDQALVMMP
jgi:hypothetical protein